MTQDRRGLNPGLFSGQQIMNALDGILLFLSDEKNCKKNQPELRILIALMCGDDFGLNLILDPLLNSRTESWNFHQENPGQFRCFKSRILLPKFGERKILVEFTIAAFHTGILWAAENIFYGGYIFVYSAKRKSSLAHLE